MLRSAGIEATITVRDDKRTGTVAAIRIADATSLAAARDALARLPLTIEFE
jgi:hypothetical protein